MDKYQNSFSELKPQPRINDIRLGVLAAYLQAIKIIVSH